MAASLNNGDSVNAVNEDIYLMSRYGRLHNLYGVDDELQASPKDVTHGLVSYDPSMDPREGRRSRTAILLDSIAEICVSEPGDVYAVACVVPLPQLGEASAIPGNAAAENASADKQATLIVAENKGVTIMTQHYLHDVIQRLNGISELVRPTWRDPVDPHKRSQSPPDKTSVHGK
jgi:hypothetical protein